jgi:uncharacterized lipoprotein YmbA
MSSRAARWVGLVLAAIFGCASDGIDVHEYVLTSKVAADPSPAIAGALTLAVGPVVVPAYLRRREIVTRVGDNEMRASDTHRWAEDLGHGLARVVAEDLGTLVPGLRVSAFAWRDMGATDYRVAIEVERFEPMPDGTVALTAHWELLRANEPSPVAARSSTLSEDVSGSGATAAVDAMSRAAAQLSREIAQSLPSGPR